MPVLLRKIWSIYEMQILQKWFKRSSTFNLYTYVSIEFWSQQFFTFSREGSETLTALYYICDILYIDYSSFVIGANVLFSLRGILMASRQRAAGAICAQPFQLNYCRWIVYPIWSDHEKRARDITARFALNVSAGGLPSALHTFPSSIVAPSPYLRARGIIKTPGPVTANAYVYFAMSSRGRGIPGGRRAENNKARLSSGTALPPLQLLSLDGFPPLTRPPLYNPLTEASTSVYVYGRCTLSIQFRSHLWLSPDSSTGRVVRHIYSIYCKPISSPGLS